MAYHWFQRVLIKSPLDIEKNDYVLCCDASSSWNKQLSGFANAVIEYFKTHRLTPDEIRLLEQLTRYGKKPEGNFHGSLLLAFEEGIIGQDGTVDKDAYLGTFSELIFRWIRKSFFSEDIVDCVPYKLTGSSKGKGIDYFEILGNEDVLESLYFIIWEVKGTDGNPRSRVHEIYGQHKRRSGRLLRGLKTQLYDQFEREGRFTLCHFVSRLMDHWYNNTPQKCLGGCVVFDSEYQGRGAFFNFPQHFPNLSNRSCRQVSLVKIPGFSKVRGRVLGQLWAMIGYSQKR